MKIPLFIILLLLSYCVQAQKEAAHWFFGEFAGLDFNSGSPVAQKGRLATREGCASISDRYGNLLFYTDGSEVYTRGDLNMPNGSGLFGNNSSTQSAIIVPKPGSRTIYYIFTVDNAEKSNATAISAGLNYSEVDMSLNNGLGAVVAGKKNLHLVTYEASDAVQNDWKCSEKVAAIINSDQSGYWVLTHFIDTFYAFWVDENGVSTEPVKSKTTEVINVVSAQLPGSALANLSAVGYLKISPNGKKVAIAHSFTTDSRTSGKVYMYDFNSETGVVSNNGRQLVSGTFPYGVEFSSKSRKLYISTNNYVTLRGQTTFEGSSLFQFDLMADNLLESKVEINKSPNIHGGALQLALNGKIYRAKYDVRGDGGISNLGVINQPELDGTLCNYSDNGAQLLNNTYSNYGLPPFIASTFLFTFSFEFTCFNDATHFFVTSEEPYDSLFWDFGDGSSSTEDEPLHTFPAPGIYTVSLTTTTNGIQNDPVTKKVEIVEPLEVASDPYEYFQCDLDEAPDDGITTYNLQTANDAISLGSAEAVIVYYYDDLSVLQNDPTNANALPDIYTNTSRNQLIFAKVSTFGSDCYSIGRVVLRTTEASNFTASPLQSCDNGFGEAAYDLEGHKAALLAELGLAPESEVSYHSSREDALGARNPLPMVYTSGSGSIFFRIQNQNVCSGVGELALEMYRLPDIDDQLVFTFCTNSFPVEIDAGVMPLSRTRYDYLWDGGQRKYEITVSQPGTYTVTITDLGTSCSTVKQLQVNSIPIPVIESIETEEHFGTYSATVQTAGIEDRLLFSLNEEFGPYQEEGVFDNLQPGTYTVFVKDPFNCQTVTRQFHIFGFPKFITPNNDGENDVWEVKGVNTREFTYSKVHIFNRYGKLLATLDPDEHWDGSFMGVELPSDDYWYTMTVTDSQNQTTKFTGHFSIVRK